MRPAEELVCTWKGLTSWLELDAWAVSEGMGYIRTHSINIESFIYLCFNGHEFEEPVKPARPGHCKEE